MREVVDLGSSAYSSLAVLKSARPALASTLLGGGNGGNGGDAGVVLGVLYERSSCRGLACPLVFLPDHISWVNVTL